MKIAASPVCVLARTDAELSSLFHSFYLLTYNSASKAADVTWRVPERRARIEDVESGLAIFINNVFELDLAAQDMMGSFVITTSDGSRFFAYWRGNENLMFIGVSKFPLSSFARQIFALMVQEPASSIPQILLNLCETPVLPAANTQYEFVLPSGSAVLNFSSIEQVDDLDVNLIATTLLSPSMIVAAWEAILMERKLLVTSANSGVIPACCEFLRRAVAPFSIINTYVPLLPEQLLGTIEAPFPYLLGANSVLVKNSFIDTSEVLILDIDNRCIVEPQKKETLVRAPAELRERLVGELNGILMGSLARYSERTQPTASNGPSAAINSMDYPFSEHAINARATAMLSVLIRTSLSLLTARCCRVRGFFYHQPNFEKGKKAINTGFSKSNEVAFGCLQLLLIRSTGVNRIPCWFELDSQALLVYRYADELPFLTMFNRNIISIFPSLVDPVDQVFDLTVKPNKQYVFEALDAESRLRWIEEIENAIVTVRSGGTAPGITSNVAESPRPGDSAASKRNATKEENKYNPGTPSPEHELTLFRSALLETQMASYLKPRLEFDDYETILNELQLDFISLTEPSPGPSMNVTIETHVRSSHHRDDITMQRLVSLWNEHICNPHDDDAEEVSNARMTFIMGPDGVMETDIEMLKADDEDMLDRSPSMALASPVSPSKQPSEKAGFGSSFKNFFRRSSVDEKSSASTDRASKIVGLLQKSAAEAGQDSPTTLSTGANLLVKIKEKEELEKLDVCCEMISDLHRSNDYDLKKAVVEERTWRIRLLLGEEDALKNRYSALASLSGPQVASASVEGQVLTSFASGSTNAAKSTSTISERPHVIRISVHTNDVARASASDGSAPRGGSEAAKWLEGIINDTVLDDDDDCDCSCRGKNSSGSTTCTNSRCGKCGNNHAMYKWGKRLKQWSSLGFIDGVPMTPMVSEIDMLTLPDGFTTTETSPSTAASPKKDIGPAASSPQAPQRRKLNSSNSLENYRRHLTRELMDQVVASRNDESLHALFSVLRTLMGYVYEQSNEIDEAIYAYAEGCLMSQNRLMRCIVQKFVRIGVPSIGTEEIIRKAPRVCNAQDLKTFLVWATGCGEIVKFQTFQFISELLFRTLSRRKVFVSSEDLNVRGSVSMPRSVTAPVSLGESGLTSRSVVKSASSGSGNVGGAVGPLPSMPRSILNETVMCSKATHEPCDLSVMLLQRIRDVVRGTCLQEFTKGDVASFSSQASEAQGDKRFGLLQLKYRDSIRESTLKSPGYRSFEMSVCELQKVDVSAYGDDEKTQFFVNVHNILSVHAMIANGAPGPSLFDHFMFMRNAKYNIGGIILNLMDIEHSILRGSSTNSLPAVFKRNLFSDRDVRAKLQIMRTKPQLSYVLFTATMSSPPLTVLYDAATIDADISFCTVRYLSNVVRVDLNTKSLYLPELLQFYWKDFNSSALNVCKAIMGDGPAALQADVAKLLELTQNPKIVYVPYDWTPAFVLQS